jgi:hypothetical protein
VAPIQGAIYGYTLRGLRERYRRSLHPRLCCYAPLARFKEFIFYFYPC